MENQDNLDVFVDEIGHNISFGRRTLAPRSSSSLPLKALKLSMRLPSYLRSLENPANSHEVCKHRNHKPISNDLNSLIKASIQKSRKLISKSHYSQAVDLLTKLISQNVSHSDIFYLLGEAYRLQENFSMAEEFLQKSLLMKIHPPHAYFSLGKLYSSMNRHNEAILRYQEFLKRLDNAEGHYELGRSFMWIGYFEEAIEEFTNYIQMKMHVNIDPAVLILRAEAYEAIERLDLAQKDYEIILQINPNFYAPYLEYAEELAANGMFHESKNIKEFVRKRNPR